jgi:hypothetical protein
MKYILLFWLAYNYSGDGSPMPGYFSESFDTLSACLAEGAKLSVNGNTHIVVWYCAPGGEVK